MKRGDSSPISKLSQSFLFLFRGTSGLAKDARDVEGGRRIMSPLPSAVDGTGTISEICGGAHSIPFPGSGSVDAALLMVRQFKMMAKRIASCEIFMM